MKKTEYIYPVCGVVYGFGMAVWTVFAASLPWNIVGYIGYLVFCGYFLYDLKRKRDKVRETIKDVGPEMYELFLYLKTHTTVSRCREHAVIFKDSIEFSFLSQAHLSPSFQALNNIGFVRVAFLSNKVLITRLLFNENLEREIQNCKEVDLSDPNSLEKISKCVRDFKKEVLNEKTK